MVEAGIQGYILVSFPDPPYGGSGNKTRIHTCSYTHVVALDRNEYHSVVYFECITTCIAEQVLRVGLVCTLQMHT